MSAAESRTLTCANGMPGHLALPAGTGRVPAVIILHERYGFVAHPRQVAERFAGLGMAGFAVNCFFKCTFQPDLAAGTKRYFMTDPESATYITAAIAALGETGRVDLGKIAVLGMCQTGRHPIVMGAAGTAIAAAVCWYGAGSDREFDTGPYYPAPLADIVADLHCPFLGLFGETDNHIPIRNVRRLRALLEQHGKSFEIALYEGAPHGFLNDTMKERYRPREAEAAWRRQMAFLEKAFSGGFDTARVEQRFAADLVATG